MTQNLLTVNKCRTNFLPLLNSREYFSAPFRRHPDVTYYELVVLHLKRFKLPLVEIQSEKSI